MLHLLRFFLLSGNSMCLCRRINDIRMENPVALQKQEGPVKCSLSLVRTMTTVSWLCFLAALLSLGFSEDHNHGGETDTYQISVGHVFVLRCPPADLQSEVMWSRGDGPNETLPTGVEVKDGLLWFLPVQVSHQGIYICKTRDQTGSSKRTFGVSVSSGDCPDPNEDIIVTESVNGGLSCKQTEFFRLNVVRNVRWMKDCTAFPLEEEYINADGLMKLPAVSQRDAGIYTCLIDVTINGRNYTAARSIQLTVNNGTPEVFPELQVVSPQQDIFVVQVGQQAEVQCLAYTGFSEDEEILMFWTINGSFINNYKELNESWKFINNRGKVYGQSTLYISKVLHQFLNVPIQCNIFSPVENKFGLAWLIEADNTNFFVSIALCLSCIFILLLAAASFFCKITLVLSYRKLTRHFSKPRAVSDGKCYDAYVSIVQSDTINLNGTTKFALQILPEELEKKHGYTLYIRGRDDCPGEAMHSVISTTMHQCHRLIIILSPESKSKETTTLCENQSQLLYEQEVGLHDALTRSDPKIILVEVDGPVDYSHLPESLRYIKRNQGALKWENLLVRTNKLTVFNAKRNFWRNLLYHMPAVPVRPQTVA